MTKVKTFLHVLKNSFLPNHVYYPKLSRVPLSFSLKYFASLVFVVNALFFVIFLSTHKTATIKDFGQHITDTTASYPKDLEMRIQNGHLTTNSDRPIFLWSHAGTSPRLAAVVDERSTPEKIQEYDSVALFSHDSLVMYYKPLMSRPIIMPYRSDTVIDKSRAEVTTAKLQRFFNILTTYLWPIAFLIVPLIIFALSICYIFVLSLVAHPLYVQFLKGTHSFAKTFQIGLHAATLPLIAYYGVHLLKISLDQLYIIPIVFINLMVIFVLAGLHEAYGPLKHK